MRISSIAQKFIQRLMKISFDKVIEIDEKSNRQRKRERKRAKHKWVKKNDQTNCNTP